MCSNLLNLDKYHALRNYPYNKFEERGKFSFLLLKARHFNRILKLLHSFCFVCVCLIGGGAKNRISLVTYDAVQLDENSSTGRFLCLACLGDAVHPSAKTEFLLLQLINV